MILKIVNRLKDRYLDSNVSNKFKLYVNHKILESKYLLILVVS
jgi:hypothetical protein